MAVTTDQTYQDQINKQQQTPYASQTGMNTGGAPQQNALDAAISGPLSPTGNEPAKFTQYTPSTAPKPAVSSTSAATTRTAAAQTGMSPVTGDGKINEANAPAPPPPVTPAPAPSPVQMTVQAPATPAPAAGWVNIGGNWVPPDHPMALQGSAGASTGGTTGGTSGSSSSSSSSSSSPAPMTPMQMVDTRAYPAGFFDKIQNGSPIEGEPGMTWYHTGTGWAKVGAGGIPGSGVAQTVGAPGWQPSAGGTTGSLGNMGAAQLSLSPGGMPLRQATTEWNPGTLDQYTGQINGQMESQVQDALTKAIQGGGGLPVELLKARTRDNAMTTRDNELQTLNNQLAGMGRTGGGFQAAMNANLRENALQGVLGGYQNIDIEDANARNKFGLDAINTGNTYLTGQQDRQQGNFTTRQQGQLNQENLLLDAATNNRNNYLADLQGYLGNKGIDTGAATSANQTEADKYRARLGLTGDLLNVMERARASDQSTGVNWGQIQAGLMGQL